MRVQVGDVRLHFDVEGPSYAIDEGRLRHYPTALLLPGGPGQGHFHNKHIPPFPRDLAQVVHIDHRGTGKSDRSAPDRWNLATWTEDVVGFCQALEIAEPILVGVSFGATLALNIAQQHPDLPSRLILVSGPARFDGELILDAFERLGGTAARAAAEKLFVDRDMAAGAEYLKVCAPLYSRTPVSEATANLDPDPYNAELFFTYAREARTLDLRRGLEHVACPTLILGGNDDPIVPPELCREIADGIRPELATIRLFDDCGHNPFFDRHDDAMAAVREWMSASA